jgi:DNA uptake protein ComE-like DNA-binding protein
MKSALVFAIGALGLLAFANYRKSGARVKEVEQPIERVRRPRARTVGLRHRNQDGLLDLNSATLFELKGLAGIDDDFAERILENRPYLTKLDLVARRIIPDAAYEAIKHSITAVHAA